VVALQANISFLLLMRTVIGNHCKFIRRGVTFALFGLLKAIMDQLQRFDSVTWKGLPREHYNSPIWIEQELGQGVV